MQLYNSRTRKIEEFKSLENSLVKMYSCGPTVYDHAHIGNLRAYVFVDLLKKTLIMNGYKVTHVMNITDFGHLVGDTDFGEDKMSEGLKRENLPRTLEGMKILADKYTEFFITDLQKMNISMPDFLPRASENIPEYIKIIEGLDKKGFVYKISDGLYFDTARDPNYGYMSLLKNSKDDESRIGINSEKKNSKDFALWKFSSTNKTSEEKNNIVSFQAPFGDGFPGWHIECSGMAMKYLGETLDIHTGGIDHISIHHTNEIAQSENYTGKTFSNFFCHNAFIDIDNSKMSKSKNNFYTLNSIIENNFSPLAYRYLILQTSYRQNLNFTFENLKAAQNALDKLKKQISELVSITSLSEGGELGVMPYLNKFNSELSDDLNTAQALATLWTLLKDNKITDQEKYFAIKKMDEVFSLDLFLYTGPTAVSKLTPLIQKLIDERNEFRKNKNFGEADRIRDELKKMGYDIEDK